jgi:type III secretion protein Q
VKRTLRRVSVSSLRPLSRAAAALGKAGPLCESGALASAKISESLTAELKVPVRCAARLLEAPARAGGLPEGCCYLVLALGTDGRRALVELESGIAATLVERLSGGASREFAPQALSSAESAALSYLALHGLRAARSVPAFETALAPRFLMLARDVSEAGEVLARERSWVAIELELDVGGTRGSGRLLLPAMTATRIARDACRGLPRRPLPKEIGSASLGARLVAGSAELSERELAQLGEGDAIVLNRLSRSGDGVKGRARLLFGDFHLCGRLDGRMFTLASVADAQPQEAFMHDSQTQVTALPIEIEVELARIKVPLAKLDQLQPGAVLDLDTALTEPVVLRVGDRAVARAELVDIEGELGARIIALLP